jgi:hypothetical protein
MTHSESKDGSYLFGETFHIKLNFYLNFYICHDLTYSCFTMQS